MNASRRRREAPSVPDASDGGRVIHCGRAEAGTEPWWVSSCNIGGTELNLEFVSTGSETPMILAMLATTWVKTGGVIASA